jgi:hypothetical protein
MESNLTDQNIRPYLLGTLVEAEQQQLEESLLTSDELFEELLVAEDELIDEYLAGQLTDSDRERFEQRFLSTPERMQKLRFARAFKRHVTAASRESPASSADDPQPAFWKRWLTTFLHTQSPALNFSLATVLMLLVGGGLWIMTRSYREPQIAANGGPHSSSSFPLTLTPGVVRDAGEMKRVLIPTGVEAVQVRLELATADYESYRAMLLTDEGQEVFTGDKLRAEITGGGKFVVFSLPAKLLKQSDYQVRLSGVTADGNLEDVGRYYFRVVQG